MNGVPYGQTFEAVSFYRLIWHNQSYKVVDKRRLWLRHSCALRRGYCSIESVCLKHILTCTNNLNITLKYETHAGYIFQHHELVLDLFWFLTLKTSCISGVNKSVLLSQSSYRFIIMTTFRFKLLALALTLACSQNLKLQDKYCASEWHIRITQSIFLLALTWVGTKSRAGMAPT